MTTHATPLAAGPDTTTLADRVTAVLPVLRDEARTADEHARFPERSLRALRDSGLMGLLVPVEYGGLGGRLDDLVYVAGELAGSCLSTAMIWAMHCQQVAVLVDHADPRLRARLLPDLGAGTVYVASVTSEKGKGGHLLSAASPLRRAGGDLHIRRDAPIVTGGLYADGFLITMRDSESAPPSAVTLVYAARTDLSVQTSGDWNPLGMRGTHSVAMRLEGRVDDGHVVGVPGDFRTVAVSRFIPVGHIGWAACWLGAARSAMRAVLGMMRDPRGRGQFNVRSDLVRARLARIRLDLDTMAALLGQVVREVDRADDPDAVPLQLRLNGLKVLASERSFEIVDTLIQLVGLRHGYLRDAPVPLERLFRDLRSASLNYANERLLLANGALTLMDRDVTLDY
jgi:acyl-CoA dehydrogenase